MSTTEVKVGQVWQDKDKRRDTVIEIIRVPNDMRGDAEVIGLVVGTEDERSYRIDRLVKRWHLVKEKGETSTKEEIATHDTREAWLKAAVVKLRDSIFGEKHPVPEVHVSVGWPGGRGPKANTIGQCWPGESSADNVGQIFISPVLSEPVNVLETLVHELIHAINHKDGEHGHRGPFKRIAEELGLEGKMTSTVAGPELAAELEEIGHELGLYPHSKISIADKPKTQKTYQLKATCVYDPEYKVRMTQKMAEEWGMPLCPCHKESMEFEH